MRSISELLEEAKIIPDTKFKKQLEKAVSYLNTKGKVLLITTSNRVKESSKDGQDRPKSTRIAEVIQRSLGAHRCTLVDVSKLKIYNCEGNVSSKDGNNCGVREAKLQDKEKNPSGNLRCWASYNNADDELWKVVTPLLESHVVVFLGSIRWGQANAYYQKLIERLDWIENRHTTLGERNIVKDIESGFIFIGQNWNGANVVKTQKQVHEFYGFKPADELYFNWQFTDDAEEESKDSYREAVHALDNIIDIRTLLK
jgi:multimeric flavodoxin WrbA